MAHLWWSCWGTFPFLLLETFPLTSICVVCSVLYDPRQIYMCEGFECESNTLLQLLIVKLMISFPCIFLFIRLFMLLFWHYHYRSVQDNAQIPNTVLQYGWEGDIYSLVCNFSSVIQHPVNLCVIFGYRCLILCYFILFRRNWKQTRSWLKEVSSHGNYQSCSFGGKLPSQQIMKFLSHTDN